MSRKKIVIAVDGHSSCGKSTLAKSLARELGYTYIDSGAMYRAVTLFALREGLITGGDVDEAKLVSRLGEIKISFEWEEESERNTTYLNGDRVEEEIRLWAVSNHVSPVSTIPGVRRELVKQQREMAREGGVVMDGRDIGSVVFPHADLKIFMTASPEIRAGRRFLELKEKGAAIGYQDILKNVRERDAMDSSRKESPLRKADDALVLDNSHLTREEQLQWALEKAKKVIEGNEN